MKLTNNEIERIYEYLNEIDDGPEKKLLQILIGILMRDITIVN